MVSEKETRKIVRYQSEEIPLEEAINGMSQLTYNVKRKEWYHVFQNKRRKLKGPFIEIRFSKEFLRSAGMRICPIRRNIKNRRWLEDFSSVSSSHSQKLDNYIMGRITSGYNSLDPDIRNKCRPEDIVYMILGYNSGNL